MKATILSLLLAALVSFPVVGDDKPAPKIPLGRDTSFVLGPFDKQGYIDYEAALNAELSRGVTVENNANVLLWMVFGPRPEGSEMPAGFYKWLNAPPPPADGDYFIGMGKLFREQFGLTNEQMEAVFEVQSRATQRTWEPKDCPPLAEWLKANEKHLDLAARAVQRTRYFNPLVSRKDDDQPSSLIGVLLPSVQKCRELASAFALRATLRIREEKFDDAWQDILAVHRLGRLISRGGTLIEGLVGVAIGQIASNVTLVYLDRAKLTAKQAQARLKDLQQLPALAPLPDKIDIVERIFGLETLQNIRRGGGDDLSPLFRDLVGMDFKPTAEELKVLDRLDWAPAMTTMNRWYDRLCAAARLTDRAARTKEFDKFDEEMLVARKKVEGLDNLARLLGEKDAAKSLAEVLVAYLSPSFRRMQTAYERAEQAERNLSLAFALAAFQADNGRYPNELKELAPTYLPTVPGDVFSGKSMIYKPEAKGFLLYSVGPNGEDEGGRFYDDDPSGDDPRVRMPLPPLKKK